MTSLIWESKAGSIKVSFNKVSPEEYQSSILTDMLRVGTHAPWEQDSPQRYADTGNDVLYHYCEVYKFPNQIVESRLEKDIAIFASKMWLIGRSYAASPERYAYVGDRFNKPKDSDKKGYEPFFKDIAATLFTGRACYGREKKDLPKAKTAHEIFSNLLKRVQDTGLNHRTYFVNSNDQDYETLVIVDELIRQFARAIQYARIARDEMIISITDTPSSVSLEAQHYPLSFCSKFLHFHYPQAVFIFDSKVAEHLSPNVHIKRRLNDDVEIQLDIERGLNITGKYLVHATKELALAKALYLYCSQSNREAFRDSLELGKIRGTIADPIPCYFNITRLADIVASNALPRRKERSSSATHEGPQHP